jgi:hypothetical protein
LASARENAWPRPVFPPVTTALFPRREKRSVEKSRMSNVVAAGAPMGAAIA